MEAMKTALKSFGLILLATVAIAIATNLAFAGPI
jgi:hypothetical protein